MMMMTVMFRLFADDRFHGNIQMIDTCTSTLILYTQFDRIF